LRNCFGCRRGWGTSWWGYYDPWLWNGWDSDSSYDNDYNDNLAIANEMNENSLAEQRMLRKEQAEGDQDAYADRSQANPPLRPPESDRQGTPVLPATVLVFRDQRTLEVHNYAIVGQTLWSFAAPRTQKILLSELDLAATEKANEDRGLTFTIPSTNEGQ
jgi:hypothetical protein